jgi:flagellar basal body-associated protein FliL
MEALLISLIVLLSAAICAFAGFWFYRTAQDRKNTSGQPQIAPDTERRSIRNLAWDRAVRAARNRNF